MEKNRVEMGEKGREKWWLQTVPCQGLERRDQIDFIQSIKQNARQEEEDIQ